MGLQEDLERYREAGEQRRQDLDEFIQYGDLGQSRPDNVRIPIKIVDLPELAYDPRDQGGLVQGEDGQPEEGQPVEPQPGDEAEEGDPGDESGEHDYYDMDPEEFAEELDDQLGLDLEPKGKEVIEEELGDFTDIARQGTPSTLDFERLFKKGLKRKIAMEYDDDYVREAAKVEGWDSEDLWLWARENNLPISRGEVESLYEEARTGDFEPWETIEEMEKNVEEVTTAQKIRREGIDQIPFRPEDERYRYPEIEQKREKNVVVLNMRDVSGSMREKKRELVERTFVPMDWYLTGKYQNAEFIYIAHDNDAWEVQRNEFFGIRSGGGTTISSAYELAEELLEEYPWSEWNRYVFAAGDSENSSNDTKENVIPLMERIPANLHAYVETQPGTDKIGQKSKATHAEDLLEHMGDNPHIDNWAVTHVGEPEDTVDAITEILSTEDKDD